MDRLVEIGTLGDPPPRGVEVGEADDGVTTVEFRLTSDRWSVPACALLLLSFLFVLILSLILRSRSPALYQQSSAFYVLQYGNYLVLIVLMPLSIWYQLNKTTVRFGAEELEFTFRWCWSSKRVIVPRSQIRRVVQWQSDGGPVRFLAKWSLRLEGKETVLVTGGDGYESSYWLGNQIAQWARVPYESAVKDW